MRIVAEQWKKRGRSTKEQRSDAIQQMEAGRTAQDGRTGNPQPGFADSAWQRNRNQLAGNAAGHREVA